MATASDAIICALDVGATGFRYSCGSLEGSGSVRSFSSLEGLLDYVVDDAELDAMVLAIAGCMDSDGRTSLTNLDWPSVHADELSERYHCTVEILNDVQAAQIGASAVDPMLLTRLKQGREMPGRHLTVLTLSSGVNWATGRWDGSVPLAREAGHTLLAVPPTMMPLVNQLLGYIKEQLGMTPASIEHVLSGGQGIDFIISFLEQANRGNGEGGPLLDDATRQVITRYRQYDEPLAPLMTREAVKGHPFWRSAGILYQLALTNLLYQIVIGELVGTLVIQGSVLNRTPGFARLAIHDHRSLWESPVWGEKGDIIRDVTILGVPPGVELGLLGAQKRAQALL